MIDLDFAPMPNGYYAVGEVSPYSASGVEVRSIHVHQRVAIPGTENVGLIEGPTSPIAGGVAVVAGKATRV